MRKIIFAAALFLLFPVLGETAGPRTFGKKGTATTTNATVTFPFHPIRLCITNTDATNGLYVDWTDGIATAVDESTNFFLPAGNVHASTECFEFAANKSPFETFTVGVLAAAATSTYHINAYRIN